MKYRRNAGVQGGFFRVLLIICAAGILLFLCDQNISPYLEDIVKSQAKNYATTTINDAVQDVLSQENWNYGDFVTLQTGENQQITALSVNTQAVNLFQSTVTQQIAQNLNDGKRIKNKIAVGTLLGNDWLRERGLSLPFYYALQGDVQCELHNEFDSAGINQTRHSLMLEVTCTINAHIPGLAGDKFEQTSRIAVAETVIVGEVPESYWGSAMTSANLLTLE